MSLAPKCLLLFLLTPAPSALAEIPEPFHPVVVESPSSLGERRFDLTQAVARARAEKKLLFVYLGARDCPYCVQYERFLRRNQEILLPVYARHVVVDIRTWLRGPEPYFQVGDRKYTFSEFNAVVGGDRGRKSPSYPYFWLLTPDLKAKQLPRGTELFRTVEEHRRALSTS